MDIQTIFGILLLTSGGTAFACGLYATNGKLTTMINKLLIVICCALCIWSLGLAVTVAAKNGEISLIGHLVAPIGWGPMSGLLLHFNLLLTGRERILKRLWIYPVLYLPGLLIIFAFTVLPAFGQNTDMLIHTAYGWTPLVRNDGWDYLFYAYLIGFTVANLAVLLYTRMHSRDKVQRSQVTLLAICIAVSYALGILSDLVLEQFNIIIPQVSPVFSLLPIGAMAYLVSRHGSISPGAADYEFEITYDVNNNVYWFLSLGFVIGSFLNLFSQSLLYDEAGLSHINGFSLFLLLVAVLILTLHRLRLNGIIKEMMVAVSYSLIIPLITLRFVKYGSITIWAFIFLLIIVCLLYDRKILLITISLSSAMTQILVWAIAPATPVEVNEADYMVRLGFIGIAVFLSAFVNNVYVTKLRENSLHVQKQTLLTEISRDFISAREWNIEEILYNILEKCGKFIKCERAYVVLFEQNSTKIKYSCEWLAKGATSLMGSFENLPEEIHRIMMKRFETERIVKISDTRLLPSMAGKLKKMLSEQNVRALVSLPIKEKDRIIGFMGYNSSKPLREWNLDSAEFTEIAANIVSDMLVKIENERKIKFLAYHDQLSQLPNRILFEERLKQALKESERMKKKVGVVFIDLDSFKTFNDTMGHVLGDRLLSEVAKTLSDNIRSFDAVARFGGDEFVIMLNLLSGTQDAVAIMDKLMDEIRKPLYLNGQEFFITLSAGVAIYPQDGRDSDTLIKNADTAMYHAKSMGKNRYLICSRDMKEEVSEKMKLTNSLYRALEREQMQIYYQPLIRLDTNSIAGVEALLRWSLPERGIISPNVFIPLAEQTGLINSIGEWVLENACRQGKLWQTQGHPGLRMAVNISVHQLNNPGIVKQIDRILKKTGLSPGSLELEITESVACNNADTTISVLSRLKTLGVSISIDDFGTEYSSLSRLKILPIDRVKMDMQFVHGIEGNEKDQAIAKAIISLAKNMNLKIIAEGVETKYQCDFLNEWMCDEIQGYYCYKPMPAEEIEKILTGMQVR